MRYFVLLLATLFYGQLSGQWSTMMPPEQVTSEIAVAIEDMNGDLLEDVITFTRNGDIILLEQMPDHTYVEREIGGFSSSLFIFSVVVADFNNDDLKDFAIAGETFVPRLYTQQVDGTYTVETIGFTTIFAQGANALDIDADGWVDLMVCNDVGPSTLYRNVEGVLEEWDLIEMSTAVPSDNSGNYSSIWLDVDSDGDMDLYIAKCRAGVTDPADPRRINALYINDNGTFTEAADDYGIAIGYQSWSVSAGDLDNDGDEDMYLTNHYAPDQILVNQGDRFDVIDLVDLPEHFAFQAVIADIDLDGLLDVIVSGEGLDFVLFNQGDLQFEVDDLIMADYQSGLSLTCGDIDNDGDLDIYKNKGDLGSDIILRNPHSTINNWVRLSLSAPSATSLQTSITTYIDGQATVHVPRSGESYGIHLSTSITVGIGAGTAVDSIIIDWHGDKPSTTIYDAQSGQHLLISPEGCVGQYLDNVQETFRICDGDTRSYTAPAGYIDYRWSHGAVGDSVALGLGIYQVTATDPSGCESILEPIWVRADQLSEDDLQLSASSVCNGSPLIAEVTNGRSVLWSDGLVGSARSFSDATTVTARISNTCGDTLDRVLTVREITAVAPVDTLITLLEPAGTIPIVASDTFVIRDPFGLVRYRGTSYQSTPVTIDTTFSISTHLIEGRTIDTGGIVDYSTAFASDGFNSGIKFTVEEPIMLRSVDVFTDKAGVRRFAIETADILLWESDVQVDSGRQEVSIDFYLEEGEYVLRTITAVNQASLGHAGPRFSRDAGANFPYVSDGLVLNTTLNGSANYYYFYNWQYDRDLAICESEAASVDVRIVTSVIDKAETDDVVLYPNPSSDHITVETNDVIDDLLITDLMGRIYTVDAVGNTLDISHLLPGTYCLSVRTFQKLSTHLFVKL